MPLLATIKVITKDNQGNEVSLRALCDPGSQINLITDNMIQRLKLNKDKTAIKITGLGGDTLTNGIVHLSIKSSVDNKISEEIEAYVVKKILNKIPQKPLPIHEWPHIRKLKLADRAFHIPNDIDLLLNSEFYAQIIQNGLSKHKGAPTAQNTTFGWIVFGKNNASTCQYRIVAGSIENDELLQKLTKFWEMEKVPERLHCTPEEDKCEEIFTKTTKRDANGRYIARIPLQPNFPPITNTRKMALSRLYHMEKKFEKNETLKENYQKFMHEYEALGHMIRVPQYEICSETAIYIPHHDAGSTKFRVVFDGSCKTKGNVAINDIQLNGAKQQPELISTLMRFRTNKIALCADIAKMYRQIRVPVDQQDLQRIIWCEPGEKNIREYRLATQTYGMKSAAFVCIRTLMQVANDYEREYPNAAKAIRENFYVDDFMGGAGNADDAIALRDELNNMLTKACMELAKWSSNDIEVRQRMSGSTEYIEIDKEETNAVLGLRWKPAEDVFQFKVKELPSDGIPTKRKIASDIGTLYDPIGFLSPVIVKAKMVIQGLWRNKFDWDDEIIDQGDVQLATDWNEFRRELPIIEKLSIPRWISTTNSSMKQLHGFSDASKEAYGVAFYVRTIEEDSTINVNLVFSKSRVAPVTKATIPKLELSAAHLMSKLLQEVRHG